MDAADNITVKIEVKTSDLVEACIKALTEDGTLTEVVRCEDCKHRIIEPNDDWCECTGCDINPDGFCEEGERREDE